MSSQPGPRRAPPGPRSGPVPCALGPRLRGVTQRPCEWPRPRFRPRAAAPMDMPTSTSRATLHYSRSLLPLLRLPVVLSRRCRRPDSDRRTSLSRAQPEAGGRPRGGSGAVTPHVQCRCLAGFPAPAAPAPSGSPRARPSLPREALSRALGAPAGRAPRLGDPAPIRGTSRLSPTGTCSALKNKKGTALPEKTAPSTKVRAVSSRTGRPMTLTRQMVVALSQVRPSFNKPLPRSSGPEARPLGPWSTGANPPSLRRTANAVLGDE